MKELGFVGALIFCLSITSVEAHQAADPLTDPLADPLNDALMSALRGVLPEGVTLRGTYNPDYYVSRLVHRSPDPIAPCELRFDTQSSPGARSEVGTLDIRVHSTPDLRLAYTFSDLEKTHAYEADGFLNLPIGAEYSLSAEFHTGNTRVYLHKLKTIEDLYVRIDRKISGRAGQAAVYESLSCRILKSELTQFESFRE